MKCTYDSITRQLPFLQKATSKQTNKQTEAGKQNKTKQYRSSPLPSLPLPHPPKEKKQNHFGRLLMSSTLSQRFCLLKSSCILMHFLNAVCKIILPCPYMFVCTLKDWYLMTGHWVCVFKQAMCEKYAIYENLAEMLLSYKRDIEEYQSNQETK